MIISVIQLLKLDTVTTHFTIITHCGMELAIVTRAHAAPSTVLHGQTV